MKSISCIIALFALLGLTSAESFSKSNLFRRSKPNAKPKGLQQILT